MRILKNDLSPKTSDSCQLGMLHALLQHPKKTIWNTDEFKCEWWWCSYRVVVTFKKYSTRCECTWVVETNVKWIENRKYVQVWKKRARRNFHSYEKFCWKKISFFVMLLMHVAFKITQVHSLKILWMWRFNS